MALTCYNVPDMGTSCIKYIDIYNACTLQKAHQQDLAWLTQRGSCITELALRQDKENTGENIPVLSW